MISNSKGMHPLLDSVQLRQLARLRCSQFVEIWFCSLEFKVRIRRTNREVLGNNPSRNPGSVNGFDAEKTLHFAASSEEQTALRGPELMPFRYRIGYSYSLFKDALERHETRA